MPCEQSHRRSRAERSEGSMLSRQQRNEEHSKTPANQREEMKPAKHKQEMKARE